MLLPPLDKLSRQTSLEDRFLLAWPSWAPNPGGRPSVSSLSKARKCWRNCSRPFRAQHTSRIFSLCPRREIRTDPPLPRWTDNEPRSSFEVANQGHLHARLWFDEAWSCPRAFVVLQKPSHLRRLFQSFELAWELHCSTNKRDYREVRKVRCRPNEYQYIQFKQLCNDESKCIWYLLHGSVSTKITISHVGVLPVQRFARAFLAVVVSNGRQKTMSVF